MGRVVVVDHAGTKITLSMTRFRLPRRMLLRLVARFRMFDATTIKFPVFIPKYEIAVFDGPPKVFSLRTPDLVFYYPDADIATRKWAELAAAVQQGGLLGEALDHFITYANPREQGVRHPALERYFAKLSQG
jgi:hypothetical protein